MNKIVCTLFFNRFSYQVMNNKMKFEKNYTVVNLAAYHTIIKVNEHGII